MNKELKIGFFAILSIIVLIIGVNYLKGLNVLKDHRHFNVRYDNIQGLKEGSSVTLNGFKVGVVSNIKLLSEKNKNLLVKITIEKDFNIPDNSICKIVSQDLMGVKAVELILGSSNQLAKDGDYLVGSVASSLQDEVNSQILPLKLKTEDLIGSIDSVMTIVTAVLDKNTRESLQNSLKSLDETFYILSKTMIKVDSLVIENDDRITNIINNIETITSALSSNSNNLENIFSNVSELTNDISNSGLIDAINGLNNIIYNINNNQGNLKMLLEDDQLYLNLEKITNELSELLKDIKHNPSRYVNFSIIGNTQPYQSTEKKIVYMGTDNLIFLLVFIISILLFVRNLKRIIANINLGIDINRSDRPLDRWKNMIRVALGQSKMTRRPIAGILHIIIYVGFVIINIEVIEIIVDGIFGTHRFLFSILPDSLYNFLIGSFEILAFLVLIACVFFFTRRNLMKIKRFFGPAK